MSKADVNVASDVSSADKCDLQIIIRTFASKKTDAAAPPDPTVDPAAPAEVGGGEIDCFFFKVYANTNAMFNHVTKVATLMSLAAITSY